MHAALQVLTTCSLFVLILGVRVHSMELGQLNAGGGEARG